MQALEQSPWSPPPWRPLLHGAIAKHARAVVAHIARVLADEPLALGRTAFSDGSAAGRALFFGYLAKSWPTREHRELAELYFERLLDLVQTTPADSRRALYGGLAGSAWTVEHLCHLAGGASLLGDGFDEELRARLVQPSWPGHHDLVSGLVGYGVYTLERLPAGVAAENLGRIVDRLAELSVAQRLGFAWRSQPAFLGARARAQHPRGCYHLGVARGTAAVIALLAAARAACIRPVKAALLYDGAVAWLMAQRLPEDAPSVFPYWVRDGARSPAARAAWGNGDVGIAVALLAAARAVGDEVLERAALAIARRASERPGENCGVHDAGVAHGAAGLAHVFNRLWQATGEETFAWAARRWLVTLLRAAAGSDRSLLMGIEGIGLTLLAALSPTEPAWDRLLLASLPC